MICKTYSEIVCGVDKNGLDFMKKDLDSVYGYLASQCVLGDYLKLKEFQYTDKKTLLMYVEYSPNVETIEEDPSLSHIVIGEGSIIIHLISKNPVKKKDIDFIEDAYKRTMLYLGYNI